MSAVSVFSSGTSVICRTQTTRQGAVPWCTFRRESYRHSIPPPLLPRDSLTMEKHRKKVICSISSWFAEDSHQQQLQMPVQWVFQNKDRIHE
jgi:hypothetical protein